MRNIKLNPMTSGTTWRGMRFTVNRNGEPLNLTGATIEMQLRSKSSSGDLVAEWLSSNGSITIPNPPGGEFVIQSKVIEGEGLHVFDIKVTDASDIIRVPVNGSITINPAVTHE